MGTKRRRRKHIVHNKRELGTIYNELAHKTQESSIREKKTFVRNCVNYLRRDGGHQFEDGNL